MASTQFTRRSASVVIVVGLGAGVVLLVPCLLLAVMSLGRGAGCPDAGAGVAAVAGRGGGQLVGASEYGGPGDPSSGNFGSSGADLRQEPDSYAELGGRTFATAAALGGLPYGTPLRITWGRRSTIAYKRDIGLGGPPVDGLPRAIDLWWRLAVSLGIPYRHGLWSGPVRVEQPPPTGAAAQLGGLVSEVAPEVGCGPPDARPVGPAPGDRAVLLPGGRVAAPAGAPAAVKVMIAAGNQLVGLPYVWGGGHTGPPSELVGGYDCSGAVSRILYEAGLLPGDWAETSGELESFGRPGPGRWVTLYASPAHVFMYVADVRWDTHDAAGPGDGSVGLGWHPLVRDASGFVARHPEGL